MARTKLAIEASVTTNDLSVDANILRLAAANSLVQKASQHGVTISLKDVRLAVVSVVDETHTLWIYRADIET